MLQSYLLSVHCYLFQQWLLHCESQFLMHRFLTLCLFRYSYLTGRYFFCSRFYFENDFEIFYNSFFHPYFFQFLILFFSASEACLALEFISLRILQNQINMFGVLVVVLDVQFTKTKVAIHANVSWSSVASRSVSFFGSFFSSSSQPMRNFYFFRKIILADHCPENGPCAPRTSQVRISEKKEKNHKKF